jgi:outer membrane protein assembly factor BamD (BamD/ComL family)
LEEKIMVRFLRLFIVTLLGLTLLTGCGQMPDERLIEKARQLDEDQQFAEAVEAYTKLAKHFPKSIYRTEALYRAGLVYTNAFQEYDRAISLLESVIAEYPEDRYAAQCQFMIGFIHANSTQDTSKARLAYRTFLDEYPDHELAPSVEWELEHLGKDINEIPELKRIEND